jgi:Rrf2 family protein
LAINEGKSFTTSEIAQSTKVPMAYLSKVLQTLSRGGIVQSQRGLGGGFTLAQDADSLTVLEVVDAVDPIHRVKPCPVGHADHGDSLCPLHKYIDETIALVENAFAQATVKDLVMSSNRVPPLCTIKKPKRAKAKV